MTENRPPSLDDYELVKLDGEELPLALKPGEAELRLAAVGGEFADFGEAVGEVIVASLEALGRLRAARLLDLARDERRRAALDVVRRNLRDRLAEAAAALEDVSTTERAHEVGAVLERLANTYVTLGGDLELAAPAAAPAPAVDVPKLTAAVWQAVNGAPGGTTQLADVAADAARQAAAPDGGVTRELNPKAAL